MNELKMFVMIFACIILIVICMLSKYIPITDKEFYEIKYIPSSQIVLTLEDIENK